MIKDKRILESVTSEAKIYLDDDYTYALDVQKNEEHLSTLLNNYQKKKTGMEKAKKDLDDFYSFNKAVKNYLNHIDTYDSDFELFIYNKWRYNNYPDSQENKKLS